MHARRRKSCRALYLHILHEICISCYVDDDPRIHIRSNDSASTLIILNASSFLMNVMWIRKTSLCIACTMHIRIIIIIYEPDFLYFYYCIGIDKIIYYYSFIIIQNLSAQRPVEKSYKIRNFWSNLLII